MLNCSQRPPASLGLKSFFKLNNFCKTKALDSKKGNGKFFLPLLFSTDENDPKCSSGDDSGKPVDGECAEDEHLSVNKIFVKKSKFF